MFRLSLIKLFAVVVVVLLVNGQQIEDDEKQRVTISPNEIEVAVREGQEVFLTCKIEGPAIRNCSWEMNGAVRTMESLTIENRIYHTKHYGKCRISLKVTMEDIGQWTCNIFTEDDDARPKSATTHVSLIQKKQTTIAGLVTIIIIGFFLLIVYVVSFGLLKICRFDTKEKSFKGNKKKGARRQQAYVSTSALSRCSSGENSHHFEEDIAMTTKPIDRS